jgi:Tfp pilus assembly protein PilZ
VIEKRKYKRAKVKIKACYSEGAYTNVIANVIDISKGGMYVQDGYAPEVQENLVASLDAEDLGKVIWVEGRVVRKTSDGIGVLFTNTDEKDLDNLLILYERHVLISRRQ